MYTDEFNNLKCCCDWLEFTIFDYDMESDLIDVVYFYVEYIGLCVSDFEYFDKGLMGYRCSFRHFSENIIFLFNGNDDMGIHVRISGSSVTFALSEFLKSSLRDTPFPDCQYYDIENFDIDKVFNSYLVHIKKVASFTRIDLAIDDIGVKYFDCDRVAKLADNNQVVSKFRCWDNHVVKCLDGTKQGHTVYFGKRTSDVYLRVYDKALESLTSFPWVRWELEVKHEKADLLADELINSSSFALVSIGLLSNYIRFVKLDDSNISRCSTLKKWAKFIENVEKIKLSIHKKESLIDDKIRWIERQVKPTIAGLTSAYCGDISFLLDDLERHYERLKAKEMNMYEDFQREMLKRKKMVYKPLRKGVC